MARVIWDAPGSRVFETGVDQGMLYIDPDPGIPWNGIIRISENPSGGPPQEFYLDGVKYISISAHEDYSATVEAFTLPPEFIPCTGLLDISPGLFVSAQPRKPFGFSYRTLIGDDIQGTDAGYRLHLVYNAYAGLSGYSYDTQGSKSSANPYSLSVTTVPETVAGYRPSAHFIIDSRKTDPRILGDIEDIIYGDDANEPALPTVLQLVTLAES